MYCVMAKFCVLNMSLQERISRVLVTIGIVISIAYKIILTLCAFKNSPNEHQICTAHTAMLYWYTTYRAILPPII